MIALLGELTARAISTCCAGSALIVGGTIGLFSLRASPEKRGQIFHRGTKVAFSKVSLAAFAAVMLVLGGCMLIFGLTSRFPVWALPMILGGAIVFMVSARNDTNKNA